MERRPNFLNFAKLPVQFVRNTFTKRRQNRKRLQRAIITGQYTMTKVQIIVNDYLLGEELELSRAFNTRLRQDVKTVDYIFKQVCEAAIEFPRMPLRICIYLGLRPAWEKTKVWVDEILFYKEAQLEIFGE